MHPISLPQNAVDAFHTPMSIYPENSILCSISRICPGVPQQTVPTDAWFIALIKRGPLSNSKGTGLRRKQSSNTLYFELEYNLSSFLEVRRYWMSMIPLFFRTPSHKVHALSLAFSTAVQKVQAVFLNIMAGCRWAVTVTTGEGRYDSFDSGSLVLTCFTPITHPEFTSRIARPTYESR